MFLIYISRYRSYSQFLCFSELFFWANYCNKGYILLINVSLHSYQNLCIRSVTVIQYEYRLYNYLWYDDSLLKCAYVFLRKMFFILYVPGLLAGNTISVTLILMNDLCRSQGLHLIPFFHPFHVTFILWIEWVFNVFLFSFDGIIIPLPPIFVNTFFNYFRYNLFYSLIISFNFIYFLYILLISDNLWSSGYSQSAFLLAHNQITAPDTGKSPSTAYCFSQLKQGISLIR